MTDRADAQVAVWLALILFGVYLLSFSGLLYSQDSMSMFSVTESFVKRGELNTDQLWTLFKARNEIALDDESYAKYGYGMSLFAAPLYALAFYLPFDLGLTQTTLLTSSLGIALTGALVCLAARRLQFSRGVSISAALLFGLSTPAWVYAKQFWSEPYSLFTLFAAFYFMMRFRAENHAHDAGIAGIALGLAVATRVTNAALVPLFLWYGFAHAWRDVRARHGVVWFALALTCFAVSIAWYDWARYGNPLATGYRADEKFDNPIGLGLYGLLFSPGKGLFVYIPFLATLAFSAPMFYRRARREAIVSVFLFTFCALLFSAWYYWWGGTNWGPRFLVPTIPFLVLLSAPAIELSAAKTNKLFTTVFAVLCALSVAIQLLGITIPSLAYRLRMMRVSANPDMDAIFLSPFSPLVGYFNSLKLSALDYAWMRVESGEVSVDWLVIALTLAFIALCLVMLTVACQRQTAAGGWWSAVIAVTFIAIAPALFSMFCYRDDARFGGGAGYRALVGTVARAEQARDVMILNDDARAPYFFNANRARLRWYGLSRDPNQFDDATRALLIRLTQEYVRVWFAYDDVTAELPDPTRDWLDTSLHKSSQHDFDDGVHLILYETGAQ